LLLGVRSHLETAIPLQRKAYPVTSPTWTQRLSLARP